ncbi:MAG: glycine/sarcosine/betaine reductase component B subunit [Synergistaceae bacterium]|nr:glycine/sarcosine/betaine reductase component B subunit [Synergistaceae bacterium]MBQ6434625.1 glycine/sarcosine/betaine reductase component B subunit [Synergistaceae bacterium]MBQ6737199.1 glycine/sarcosine/betaine reductase component B subunit [Synergistaceae bacterium]MBQ7068362.1 glycine/sarcosine/betaine reductase component B subunit [Synergistaceae bacterium]MBR0080066.1 glycine/sarcosine/betaine reductase component B subunit [Synergistaceae bacterium]
MTKLELHKLNVKSLKFSDKTFFADGVLNVNKSELLSIIAEDPLLGKNLDVDLAMPGEKVRIMPVKDVIEPRYKIEGKGQIFPGMLSDVESVGEGKTLVLSGCAVLTAGKLVRFQEGIIDMSGPGAEFTPYSKTCNVVLVLEPSDPEMDKHDYEKACRMAGLKAAAYLAKSCADSKADKVEEYEFANIREAMNNYPELPKVGYLYMLQTQGLLHDTYLYGVDVKRILPTLISPLEVMDGAIVSGNCVSACDKNSTYSHQNNPVIADMLKRHGKDFNFVGCIVTNENVTLADKKRSSSYATKLAAMLGLDGVVITEEGFGNPDADLIMNCWKAERLGIKTALLTDEYAGQDGASQSLADSCPEGNACVTAGNANEVIVLPPMEKVIGYAHEANVIAGGWNGSLADDGTITVELQAITGATSELGFTKLGAYTL